VVAPLFRKSSAGRAARPEPDQFRGLGADSVATRVRY